MTDDDEICIFFGITADDYITIRNLDEGESATLSTGARAEGRRLACNRNDESDEYWVDVNMYMPPPSKEVVAIGIFYKYKG